MISAPLARASVTSFTTFGTESAQRLRRSGVQVCLVKSITSSAVSLGSILAGLSGGGGGNLGGAPFLDHGLRVRGRNGGAKAHDRAEQKTVKALHDRASPDWLALAQG